jgi:hypothetical protein
MNSNSSPIICSRHRARDPVRLNQSLAVRADRHSPRRLDAHERAQPHRRLASCPASITVLLLCLPLKQFALGATLVLCFSIGLAITMVSVGAAALCVHHASQQWSRFAELARRAPNLSSVLIIGIGLYTFFLGWSGLATHAGP